MNHVYGNGDVPKEAVYKTFSRDLYLPTYDTVRKSQLVVAEVLVQFDDESYEKPLTANVIAIRWKGIDVTNLALTGWDESEIIEAVCGKEITNLL